MNYSLHPEASQDLDDAAAYYQKQAGNILSHVSERIRAFSRTPAPTPAAGFPLAE